LNGLLGIGGGAVIVPMLVFMAGFRQKEAQAASLWFVAPVALFSGFLYVDKGAIDIPVSELVAYVASMVVAAFCGAAVGVRFVKQIRQNKLKQVFAVFIILLSVIVFFKARYKMDPIFGSMQTRFLVTTWTGFAAGFLGSLLGIGGGVLVVPALVLIGGFSQKTAQGISLWYVVPTGFFSAMLYHYHAKIRIEAAQVAGMIATGLIGAYIGVVVLGRSSNTVLQIVFAAALAGMGIIILRRALKERRAAPPPDWII
jgi:uncharacterized protein